MLNTRDLWGETFASMRRIVGVLRHPRSTMAAVVAAPSWLAAWVIVLLLWLVPGGWLLSTPVGRQALVDERVRRVEAFGGSIDDAEYGALRQSPPLAAYFTSGGRPLLAPAVTLAVGPALGVLAIQQLVAVPLHYLRESLTSPTNLAVFLPNVEDGTAAARLLGAVDLFGLWWIWLLALGLAAVSGRPARRYLGRLLLVYVGVAAGIAGAMTLSGGS